VLGSLATLVLGIAIVAQFDPSGGLQHTVDESWIPTLGVRYQLGIDGISLFLVLLTTVLWLAATLWSAIDRPERPRLYFLMFGLAETAVLGAFVAQDLILFVLFFDLMLIPFYFLFGSWGQEHPGRPEEGEAPIRPVPAPDVGAPADVGACASAPSSTRRSFEISTATVVGSVSTRISAVRARAWRRMFVTPSRTAQPRIASAVAGRPSGEGSTRPSIPAAASAERAPASSVARLARR
jgi:NADH:ubiquinone oxidoreductase subunit 5 (subunit L)/multisubunit Na+/H+ antiporter MnhA subunit